MAAGLGLIIMVAAVVVGLPAPADQAEEANKVPMAVMEASAMALAALERVRPGPRAR